MILQKLVFDYSGPFLRCCHPNMYSIQSKFDMIGNQARLTRFQFKFCFILFSFRNRSKNYFIFLMQNKFDIKQWLLNHDDGVCNQYLFSRIMLLWGFNYQWIRERLRLTESSINIFFIGILSYLALYNWAWTQFVKVCWR